MQGSKRSILGFVLGASILLVSGCAAPTPTPEPTVPLAPTEPPEPVKPSEPEAMWVIDVKDSPVVVTMDSHGGSQHAVVDKSSKEALDELLSKA